MPENSNVNLSRKQSKFGENLHYLTEENIQRLWDVIDNYEHKLMLRLIYKLGCMDHVYSDMKQFYNADIVITDQDRLVKDKIIVIWIELDTT